MDGQKHQGLMAVNRSIFKPDRLTLSGDKDDGKHDGGPSK